MMVEWLVFDMVARCGVRGKSHVVDMVIGVTVVLLGLNSMWIGGNIVLAVVRDHVLEVWVDVANWLKMVGGVNVFMVLDKVWVVDLVWSLSVVHFVMSLSMVDWGEIVWLSVVVISIVALVMVERSVDLFLVMSLVHS